MLKGLLLKEFLEGGTFCLIFSLNNKHIQFVKKLSKLF